MDQGEELDNGEGFNIEEEVGLEEDDEEELDNGEGFDIEEEAGLDEEDEEDNVEGFNIEEGLDEEENIEEGEQYLIDSTYKVRKSKKHQAKKTKELEKKAKKEEALQLKRSTATVPESEVETRYYSACKLNACNVCGKVSKTPKGGNTHRKEKHPKHKFRCQKMKSCGSAYEEKIELDIHGQRNPGH